MWGFVKKEPSAVLFAAQLLGLLVYPLLGDDHVQRTIISAFGVLFLGLVVLAVRDSPGLTGVAVALGIPAAVLLLIQAITGDDALLPYSSAIEAILYFYAAGALVAYMLRDHEITRDELFAVGATFTLVAWAFAYLFTVVQAVEPGSFGEGERTWIELLFLSFSNLSGTGLSDITPTAPFARSMIMFEQLAGLGYIVIVVSRLVALTVRRPLD